MAEFGEEEIVENPTLRAAYNLEPLHQNQPLRWDYEVNLIAEKIYDKTIHLCEICELPILVYGRMFPCKHIFCFDCARKCDKSCKRCNGKVMKVEKSALGTVFVCTHGAPKHSTKGCRRTYLSQRDLQSHIAHRHVPKPISTSAKTSAVAAPVQPAPNQLPLTQQQAAQQTAQKQATGQPHPTPPHSQPPVLPNLNLLGPPVSNHTLSHTSSTGLSVVGQQSSPVPPLLPGLGDSRSVATVTAPAMGHNSPLLQPSPSPTNVTQGMGNPMSQVVANPMSQGVANPNLGNSVPQALGTTITQVMGNALSQGMGNMLPQGLGMINNTLSTGMGSQMSQGLPLPYSAASNPDIYRPLDMPNMVQQQHQPQQHQPHQQQHHQVMGLNSPHLQAGQNLQAYGQSQFSGPTPIMQQITTTMAGHIHPQNISAPVTSQSRTNLNLITVPIQDEGQYRPIPYVNPTMVSQANTPTSFPQSRPTLAVQSQTFQQSPMTSTSAFSPQNIGATNSSGLPFNQSGGMRANSPGMMVNPRSGLQSNLHPNMPRALEMMMHAMAVRGGGLMPTHNPVTPGVGNRFSGGRWASPRVIQPRMTQGQQRPRNEGPFNQGPYYS